MAKIAGIEMGRSMNSQFGHNVINLMPTNFTVLMIILTKPQAMSYLA